MNGTDWLRGLMRRKPKYATGGYVDTSTSLLPAETGCDYVMPTTAAKVPPSPAPPKYILTPPTPPPPANVPEQIAALLVDEWSRLSCPCRAIYSDCRCHLRRSA